MATYSVEVRDLFFAGHAVRASNVPFSDFSFGMVLNGAGMFEGTIALANVPANFTPGNREILVYRDGAQVWGGYLDTVDVDPVAKTMRVGGEGYWSRVRKRLVRGTALFQNATLNSIAWDLVSTTTGTQGLSSGDLGIRQGTHTGATKTAAKRVYCGADLRFIGDIVENFAENGNLDFELTPSRTASRASLLNTWKRRGTDRSATIALTGSNTITLDYTISAVDLLTTALVYSNNQCDMPWEPHAAERNKATYGVLDVAITIDQKELTEAQEAATEALRVMSSPLWTAYASYYEGTGPALSAYDIGDTISITPADGYTAGSKALQVHERQVLVGPEGAIVNLTLEERQA